MQHKTVDYGGNQLARLFVIFGGLLVVALFAALIGPYFIDWTSYRTAFEKEASRVLGQPVEVRGAADARLLPFPSVTFSDVAIGNDINGDSMMTVENFSMDVELAPFLSGEVRIFDMRLENPTVTMRLLPDGELEWALSARPSASGETVVLEKVAVTGATIRIVDTQNRREHVASDIDATLSARSLSGPWRVEGTGELRGRHGSFDISTGAAENGSVRLRTRILPDDAPVLLETEGTAEIADAKPHYDGTFTLQYMNSAEASEPAAAAMVTRGDFEVDNERLRIGEYRMELGGSVDPYIVTGEATVDTGPDPEFLLIADGQQVDVTAEGEDADESAAPISARDRLSALNSFLSRLPPPPLPGRVEMSLPAIIASDTTIRDVRIAARPEGGSWQVDSFAASLPGRTKVEASGVLNVGERASFAGDLVVASSQPSGLANWLTGQVDPVMRRIEQAGFSAKVSLTEQLQRFEGLEVAIGPAVLKGALERQELEGRAPSLSMDLSGDRFDIDAVRALSTLAGIEPRSGDIDQIGVSNLSAHVAAEVLTVGDLDIGEADATLVYRDGELTIGNFSFGNLAGAEGRLSGSFAGSVAAPEGSLTGTIRAGTGDNLLALANRLAGANSTLSRIRSIPGAYDDLDASFSLELSPGNGPALSASGTVNGTEFALSASGAGLAGTGEGARSIRVTADNDEAAVLAGQAGFAVLPLSDTGAAHLEVSLEGEGTAGGDITLLASAGDTSLSLEGKGALPADGPLTGTFDVALSSPDADPVLILFGQALPQTGMGLPVELEARGEFLPEAIVLSNLAGSIAGNAVNGALTFDRTAPEISVSGDLALGSADLDWLTELVLGPRLDALDGGQWSDSAYTPPIEGAPQFDILLQAESFGLGPAGEARDFSGAVAYRDGRLQLTDGTASWRGGTMSGSFNLDNPDGTAFLSATIEAKGVDVATIENAISGSAPVTGRGDFRARVEGTGADSRSLVRAITGGGELSISGFTLSGLDPHAFERIVNGADRDGFETGTAQVEELARLSISNGELTAEQVSLPFSITSGVARFSLPAVTSGAATLSGEGRLNLAAATLDTEFSLAFDPGEEAQAGAEPRIGIRVEGPLDAPERSLDVTQLANFLSVRAYEIERRRVELLQAGVLEKLRLRRILALVEQNDVDRAAAEAAEEERLRREAEERQRRAEEARAERERQAAEAARRAAEEDAARQAAEEEARQLLEQSAPEPPNETQSEPRNEIGNEDRAIERAPLAAPSRAAQPAITNPVVPDPVLPGQSLDFEELPGVRPFDLGN
nr:AsmA family protein [Pseudohoeflea suaedae]